MRRSAALVLALSTGCASNPTIWKNHDPALNNDQQLARDYGECSAQAQQAVGATGQAAIAMNPYAAGAVAKAIENQRMICMQGRGWRVISH